MKKIQQSSVDRLLQLIGNAKAQMQIAEKIGGSLSMRQAQHLKEKYVKELDQELQKFGLSLTDLSK